MNYLPLNVATFRSVFGDQILAQLANNGKFLENGNIHAASIRSAAVSVRYHAGGRTYTILERLCGKNGVDILGVDGKSADGIVGFAIEDRFPEFLDLLPGQLVEFRRLVLLDRIGTERNREDEQHGERGEADHGKAPKGIGGA